MLAKRILTKRLLAFLCILTVPAYTILYGTMKDPIKYTLSKIGNYFPYKSNFILWGIITGLLLAGYVLYIYKKAGYEDKLSKRFLFLSYVFLIVTVFVPNIKETMEFLFYIHVVTSILFAACLLMSIILFMRHLYFKKSKIYSKAFWAFIFSVGIPAAILIAFGGLTGLAEIAFFVCISAFLLAINAYLNKAPKKTFVS